MDHVLEVKHSVGISSDVHELRQRLPAPWVRAASACSDHGGVWFRDLESLRYFSDFDGLESRLNLLNVALLVQPIGQTGWRPLRDRDGMVAQGS